MPNHRTLAVFLGDFTCVKSVTFDEHDQHFSEAEAFVERDEDKKTGR